jgi:hypothetical protein
MFISNRTDGDTARTHDTHFYPITMYKNTGMLSIASMMKYILSFTPSTWMKKEMNFEMIKKMIGAMRNRLNNGESIFLYLIAWY